MQNFQELLVWQKAHKIVLRTYKVTGEMPQSENFGLMLNLRRSSVSMASRIAEGAGKATDDEFTADLKRARAVGYELEYLLLVARDLGFLTETVRDELTGDVIEVRKMLSGFVKRLNPSQ
jgi:four helix bundle protein